MTSPSTEIGSSTPQARIPNLALFRIYVGYRSLLSLVLLILLFSPNTGQMVGELNPNLYAAVALAYLASSVPLMGGISSRLLHRQNSLFLLFVVDIAAIALLSHSSGGISTGLPALLVITCAAAAVLIENRALATLVAAISALSVLADTTLLIAREHQTLNSLFAAGLLGMLFFVVSLSTQIFALRLGRVEELARSRASDLYDLQRLNEQIVQHMQTGILLIDENAAVRVMNKSAATLLAPGTAANVIPGLRLGDYSDVLEQQYQQWKHSGRHQPVPFRANDEAPTITANFLPQETSSHHDTLVFIEDYRPVRRHAQSLKVGSLGRLTASIAHEIRNPLGAISHAAQLLQESPDLSGPDRRMADIIVNHGERVNQIVESVMQISRKEAPSPQSLELATWLTAFARTYLAGLSSPAEVTIDCDYRELRIEFDPENLQRVLTNLLDNALRHSKLASAEQTARIRVRLDFHSNQTLIEVIDAGDGVPDLDRSKLFEPFFTTVREGSGMGLYLCKELCELNGADLAYRPTAQGDSCFRLSLSQTAL